MQYTSVNKWGKSLRVRGYDNTGRRLHFSTEYHPKFYLPAQRKTGWSTIHGEPVEEVKPGNMKECREFIERYSGMGIKVYGDIDYHLKWISDYYEGEDVPFSLSNLKVGSIDIETETEYGFPNVENPKEKINVITIRVGEKRYVLGVGKFTINLPNHDVYDFDNEADMLANFLDLWEQLDLDVITGWNIDFFDIPYIYNRLLAVFGSEHANRLSPWKNIRERQTNYFGKTRSVYAIDGIAVLDYQRLYQKYVLAPRESYKLDHIAEVELGKKKLVWDDKYNSMKEFYTKNFQMFVEYNIRDTDLITELEDKLKLIELQVSLAYLAKTNIEDVFSPVKVWDTIIYNTLLNDRIVIPPRERHSKTQKYEGAYVKEPIVGLHHWVVSFDLASLYPHLIMQSSISPDSIVPRQQRPNIPGVDVESLLHKEIDLSILKKHNFAIAPNGAMFRRDKRGFLPKLMDEMYTSRSKTKKEMLAVERQIEKIKHTNGDVSQLKSTHAMLDTKQMAYEILLNSAYGAIGNVYFRWFDLEQAEAITTGGQLAIRWVENALNGFINKLCDTEDVSYCLYADTDSVYLSLANLVKKLGWDQKPQDEIVELLNKTGQMINDFIETKYQELADYLNSYEQKMEMKREVIASKGFWTGKKHYALNVHDSEGTRFETAKLKIMGLDTVKSSTPAICRDAQRKAIELILTADEKAVQKFVRDFKDKYYEFSPEQIAFPRGISELRKWFDPVTRYVKGTSGHAKACILYNWMVKEMGLEQKYPIIKDGDKIKYVYLKEPNPVRDKIIAFNGDTLPPEFDLSEYVDYTTQYQKSFHKPIKDILDVIGWSIEKRNTLTSLMG
jgi:DNA polymerase elongation subunit (family B)